MFVQLIAAYLSAGNPEGKFIKLTAQSVTGSDTGGSPWTQAAGFIVRSDGKLDLTNAGDAAPPTDPTDQWVIGYPDTTYAADYECFVTEVSQTGVATRSGTMDTWIDCSTADSNRTWNCAGATGGDKTWVVTLSIRHKTSLTQYASANISMNALDGFS